MRDTYWTLKPSRRANLDVAATMTSTRGTRLLPVESLGKVVTIPVVVNAVHQSAMCVYRCHLLVTF